MHLALSSRPEETDFTPEPFSLFYQRSLFQSMRTLLRRVMQTLKGQLRNLPDPLQAEASLLLGSEARILSRLQRITSAKLDATRIRIHGDYHLGQILYTGKDFIIIDFEGEPARALTERRLKHSPFRDVAGMLRSFHYASHSALLREAAPRPDDTPALKPYADLWYQYVAGVYLQSYLDAAGKAPFIPAKKEEAEMLLGIFLLEKAVYELGYELNHRPDWLAVPLRGIQGLLDEP
jgi:maltose alpha-D-glucosyltransferase/alpha-amylase